VRAELAASYYRPVPRTVLRLTTVSSMLAALGDPYTEYLDPVAYRLLRQETAASYSGIGATVVPVRGALEVTALTSGPAREAGIRVGDRVVAVDGVAIEGQPFERALGRILGREGTALHLRVRRSGRELRFTIVRRRLSAPIVRSRLLAVRQGTVGYVRLAAFREGAAQVLRTELRRLEREGVSALVLDLRANPGGLLDQAVAVASLFLDRGVVVSVESVHRHREVLSARPSGGATRLRLVVIVDRLSASAAEVVAAALHDNRRAQLVGEHTYGKALVQTVAPLANGAALRLTTARYLTPAGIDISRRGVRPDVLAVDDPRSPADEALNAALLALTR
jgi:carboxyl-terminal processing protease